MTKAVRGRAKVATVYDVARLAGVSAQTVSRFLSGYEGIRPATRAKVEAAVEELGYRPNRAAQVLRTRRSMRIGVVVHDMFAYGPAGLLRGASRRAREEGYTLTIIGADGEDQDAVTKAFDGFEEEQAAGILAVTNTDSVRRAVDARPSDVPILVDPAEDAGITGPSFNAKGSALAARHLAELGHTRVAMLNGPEHWLPARQRRDGFLSGLEGTGAECAQEWSGDWSAAAGAGAAATFDPTTGITAIFAANDAGAIGLIHGLEARGIQVPGHVSVVGFDATPESAYMRPSLTTVEAPYEAQGRVAIDVLLSRIDGRPLPAAPPPPANLLVRGSTGSPPMLAASLPTPPTHPLETP